MKYRGIFKNQFESIYIEAIYKNGSDSKHGSKNAEFFGQTSIHSEPTKEPQCTPWLCLFLDSFVKHFQNYLNFHCKNLFLWMIF